MRGIHSSARLPQAGLVGQVGCLSQTSRLLLKERLKESEVSKSGPGATPFTRMPFSARACDSERVNDTIAPFVEE